MVPTVLTLGSSRLDAWQPCAWSMTTCQKLDTALATLILLTPCSYSWTANQRPGNTPVHSLCRASLMQLVLYSIAPKDNLHYTSVFPLTISAGLTSLYHQPQWLPLMTRTVLAKAAAGAPHRLSSEPTKDTPGYVISSKHGLVALVSYWNWQLETVWGLPSVYRTFHLFLGAECVPVSKENLTMYFHGQDSLEWVFRLDLGWANFTLFKVGMVEVWALGILPVVCYNQALMFVFQKQWCLLLICIGYISDHISYMSHIYLVSLG